MTSNLLKLCLLITTISFVACTKSSDQVREVKSVSTKEVALLKRGIQQGQSLENLVLIDDQTEKDECQTFREGLPSDYFQKFISVHEDPKNSNSPLIKVFVYGKIEQGKDPVVFFNGGPASDSHGSDLSDVPQSKDFSLIYMDQRGTGCSTPFPSDVNEKTLWRLKNYASRGIVADAEATRAELLDANTKWKIFGQSFGGLIVHRYITAAPEGVRSANAHGLSIMADADEWLKLRLLSQKRVLVEYLKEYPGDEKLLRTAQSLIPETQCWKSDVLSVCGPKVLDSLTIFLGFKSSWTSLHQVITTLVNGSGKLNKQRLDWVVEKLAFGVYASNYHAATVISMVDQSAPNPEFNVCRVPLEKLAKEGETPENWLINECRIIPNIQNSAWDPLLKNFVSDRKVPDMLNLEEIKQSLLANPLMPFYLYAGLLDVFVPYETFHEEISYLGNAVNFEMFPNSGHEGFMSEAKVWENLKK